MVEEIVELIKRAATVLPDDVVIAIRSARDGEENGSRAFNILGAILENISLARRKSVPICQDTGVPVFHVYRPDSMSEAEITRAVIDAVRRSVSLYYLRPNAVDPISGLNTTDGTGRNMPQLHFENCGEGALRINLLLKGGGSENVGAQYSLPDSGLDAGRDLDGVRRCIEDAVVLAQGRGCPPGIVGVGIGGDRSGSYLLASKQFFRRLDDENDDPVLRELEKQMTSRLNELGIGPMGLGGNSTVLGVKVAAIERHPASYFVSVAYMCWALRRASVVFEKDGASYD